MGDSSSSSCSALEPADLSSLDKCISLLLDDIAEVTNEPDEPDEPASVLYWNLGKAYIERHKLSSSATDWKRATLSLQKASSLVPLGSQAHAIYCYDLAMLHSTNFFQLGRLKDGNKAIKLFKLALHSDPGHASALVALAETLRFRASCTGSLEDLAESLILLEKSVDATSPDDCELPFRLIRQYRTLTDRYEVTGRLEDIDQALPLLCEALDHPSLRGAAKLKIQQTLVVSLLARFKASEDPGDFDKAELVIESALRTDDLRAVDQGSCLRDWGIILSEKFKFTKEKEHLDKAIERYQEAIKAYSSDEVCDSDRASLYLFHKDLANAMNQKFKMTGADGDLREALKEYNNGIESLDRFRAKRDDDAEAMLLHGLANAEFQKFQMWKRSSDLDIAIARHKNCVDLTQSTNVELALRVLSLSRALEARFDLHQKPEDLKEAQLWIEDVMRLSLPIQATAKAFLENRLGAIFLRLHRVLKESKSLDAAIEHFATAVAAGSKEPVINISASVNLGTALIRKAEITQNQTDVSLATDQFHEAMQLLKPNHPGFSNTLLIFADFLMSVYSITQQPMTGVNGLMYVKISRFVIQNNTILPEITAYKKMQAARLQYEIKEKLTLARDNLISATRDLPEAIFLGLNRSDQLRIVRNFFWLPSHAAAFSLAAGDTPEEVLRLFESSRSIIWDRLLNQNTNTDSLEEDHPALASRVKELKTQLARQILARTAIEPENKSNLTRQKIHHAPLSYKEVLENIRAEPGLGNFLLLPDGSSNLSEYAVDGPIIVVNGTEQRSDAIIIRSNGVAVLPLPMFTQKAFMEKAQELHVALSSISNNFEKASEAFDKVLLWLWTAIAEPILHDLGFLSRDEEGLGKKILPRVWWMMTGWMSNFPIHAAGDHKKAMATGEACTVIDSTVSSYINTLKALRDMRKNFSAMQSAPRESETSMESLIVQMPTTPDSIPLENAATEASSVQTLLEGAHIRGQVLDRPNRAEVLSRLKSCTVAHFACNGISDATDPSLSLLKLQDWKTQPLNVPALLQSHMTACQLVYLSAGETAASKAMVPKKGVIYLAGGFQMAGVPHVIATLWRIEDPLSVDIAAAFYETLSEAGGLKLGRAAEALRTALMAARKRGVQASLWGAYVHSGP